MCVPLSPTLLPPLLNIIIQPVLHGKAFVISDRPAIEIQANPPSDVVNQTNICEPESQQTTNIIRKPKLSKKNKRNTPKEPVTPLYLSIYVSIGLCLVYLVFDCHTHLAERRLQKRMIEILSEAPIPIPVSNEVYVN
jgi:hypothetical protein